MVAKTLFAKLPDHYSRLSVINQVVIRLNCMVHSLQLVDLVLFLSRYISAHYTMDLSMHTVETRALTEAKANFIANFIGLYSQIHMTDQQAVCLPSLASPSLYSFSLVSWSVCGFAHAQALTWARLHSTIGQSTSLSLLSAVCQDGRIQVLIAQLAPTPLILCI